MPGHILIVDDDPVNVKILGDFLARKGCEIDRAGDGEQALSKLGVRRPDLVLVDVLLPKINGLDLCRRIKNGSGPPAVFLMSAVYRSPSIQQDARSDYGADAYFVKPFRVQDLWREMEPYLGVRPPAPGSPLEGDLAAVGLARLLVTLHAAEETGALALAQERVEKIIYLDRGVPVAAESNLRSERFAEFLARRGVQKEALSDPSARDALAAQHVEERLIACFLMREGSFRFDPGIKPPPGTPRAKVPVPKLVLEGVKQHVPLLELSQEIEQLRNRVVHATPDAPAVLLGVPLDPEQARVLAAIDGQATVEQVIAHAGISAADAMPILFGLILLGVAAVEEQTRA
jgi:CheY-like chemotaxis protein